MARIRDGQSAPLIISGTDTIVGMVNPSLVEKISNYCFVVENLVSNLITIDVSDPTDIAEDNVYAVGGTGNNYVGIASDATGNYVYMLGDTSWLKTIDVSSPLAPSYLGEIAVFSSGARALVRSGNYLFATAGHYVSCIDISTPSAPVLLGSAGGFGSQLQNTFGIVTDGTYCYVTCNFTDRFTVVENAPLIAASPGSVVSAIVGSVTSSTNLDFPGAIAKSGNYCFVSSTTLNRIIAIDVSTPSSPSIDYFISNSQTSGIVTLVMAGFLYGGTSGTYDAISVINVSDPSNMNVIRYYQNIGVLDYPQSFVKDGNYLYIACPGTDIFTILSLIG